MMRWRFLKNGRMSGSANMAMDEQMAMSLAEGGDECTVRLYGWNPPAISLGWNQSAEDIQAGKAQSRGIDVVRRPTGGRAILHVDEVTYCVTMPAEGRNIAAVYESISAAVVNGLQRLGLCASLERSAPHFPTLYRKSGASACFASSARHEIVVEGRKLVGSAQRRFAGRAGTEVVLQHGSILLGRGHEQIVEFLDVDETEKEGLRDQLARRTITVEEALGRYAAFEEVAEVVKSGFETAWDVLFEEEHALIME